MPTKHVAFDRYKQKSKPIEEIESFPIISFIIVQLCTSIKEPNQIKMNVFVHPLYLFLGKEALRPMSTQKLPILFLKVICITNKIHCPVRLLKSKIKTSGHAP